MTAGKDHPHDGDFGDLESITAAFARTPVRLAELAELAGGGAEGLDRRPVGRR